MAGRGFGYVEFTDPACVDVIMETPLQHVILGKPVECKRCVPKDAMAASRSDNGPPRVMPPPLGSRPSYGAAPREDKNEAYARAYAEGYAAAKMEIQSLLNGSGPPPAAPAGKGGPAYPPAGKGKGAPYGRPY
jgi:hypothetical protein